MDEKIHLKGLNGLRAIAAISVLLAHLRILLPESPFLGTHTSDIANYAVTIFFTLSGFLITYLLCGEKKKKDISIRNFYIRRILRIWPLYFTYLALAVITIYLYKPGILPGSLAWYLFFAANIPILLNNQLPFLLQYWSLGVEEQFYIFWPWLIKRSGNITRALVIFTAVFFVIELLFYINYYKTGNDFPLFILSVNRFECMSLGGIAAMLCINHHTLFVKATTHIVSQLICWLSLLLMVLNKFHIPYIPDHDLVALVTIGLIVNLAFNKNTIINLENRLFDFLGRISYGIYIIHPLVIFYFGLLLKQIDPDPVWKPYLVIPGVTLFTVLLAWSSYEFMEKRFLHLKERYSTIKSSDSIQQYRTRSHV